MVLLVVILIVFIVLRWRGMGTLDAACIGLAAGLFLSGWDHVLRCGWYVSVMASWLPNRELLVYISAAARMTFALLLIFPATRQGALIATLVLMLIVLQVNLRIALGADIPAAKEMSPLWRWLRLSLHLGWLGWIVGCLIGNSRRILRTREADRNDQAESSGAGSVS